MIGKTKKETEKPRKMGRPALGRQRIQSYVLPATRAAIDEAKGRIGVSEGVIIDFAIQAWLREQKTGG